MEKGRRRNSTGKKFSSRRGKAGKRRRSLNNKLFPPSLHLPPSSFDFWEILTESTFLGIPIGGWVGIVMPLKRADTSPDFAHNKSKADANNLPLGETDYLCTKR